MSAGQGILTGQTIAFSEGILITLDADESFEGNLETLLQAVADPDLQGILRDNASVIRALASGSTEAARAPIVDALTELIELRAVSSGTEQ